MRDRAHGDRKHRLPGYKLGPDKTNSGGRYNIFIDTMDLDGPFAAKVREMEDHQGQRRHDRLQGG